MTDRAHGAKSDSDMSLSPMLDGERGLSEPSSLVDVCVCEPTGEGGEMGMIEDLFTG